MKYLRSMLLFLLCALMLVLPCLAQEEENNISVLDEAELTEYLAPYFEEYKLTEKNFALGFCYTGTGETYYFNGETFMYAASLFKVPLCMLVAEKVAAGELGQEDRFAGYTVTRLEEACIMASSNPIAANVRSRFEPNADELIASYCGLDYESLPEEYDNNFFSAQFMLNTLRTLYDEQERFPNILDCMLKTQPTHYFRQTLEGKYDVAQKYGQYAGHLHNAGIIYTPTPIILVVMTNRLSGSMRLIGELAEAMADYSLLLDEKHAEAVAEAERIAAEEAERLAAEEAERLAEEAERLAAKEAERLAAEEAERLAAEKAAKQRTFSVLFLSAAIILLSILLLRQRKRLKAQNRGS